MAQQGYYDYNSQSDAISMIELFYTFCDSWAACFHTFALMTQVLSVDGHCINRRDSYDVNKTAVVRKIDMSDSMLSQKNGAMFAGDNGLVHTAASRNY